MKDASFDISLSKSDNGPIVISAYYNDGSQSSNHTVNVFDPEKALENMDNFMKQYNEWLNKCIKAML